MPHDDGSRYLRFMRALAMLPVASAACAGAQRNDATETSRSNAGETTVAFHDASSASTTVASGSGNDAGVSAAGADASRTAAVGSPCGTRPGPQDRCVAPGQTCNGTEPISGSSQPLAWSCHCAQLGPDHLGWMCQLTCPSPPPNGTPCAYEGDECSQPGGSGLARWSECRCHAATAGAAPTWSCMQYQHPRGPLPPPDLAMMA